MDGLDLILGFEIKLVIVDPINNDFDNMLILYLKFLLKLWVEGAL